MFPAGAATYPQLGAAISPSAPRTPYHGVSGWGAAGASAPTTRRRLGGSEIMGTITKRAARVLLTLASVAATSTVALTAAPAEAGWTNASG